MKPSHPLSSSSPPAFNLSSIKVFCNKSALCSRWPKYWSFSFSTIPFNEYSGLISFRNDWLKLLAVQGTLKSLLQHHSLTASILHCSAFFTVQLTSTHDYWKNHSFDYMDLCWQSNASVYLSKSYELCISLKVERRARLFWAPLVQEGKKNCRDRLHTG